MRTSLMNQMFCAAIWELHICASVRRRVITNTMQRTKVLSYQVISYLNPHLGY